MTSTLHQQPRHRVLSAVLGGILALVVASVPAGLAVLVQDTGDLDALPTPEPESEPTGDLLTTVAPAPDGLRYLTRTVRIDHGIAFEGFGWAAGPRMTIVRSESLAAYADPAAAAWEAALPEMAMSVRTGDGCAWRSLAPGEVGFCGVSVPYTSGETWDGTADVAVDPDRGIHKARVRLNFFSDVLAEPDELSVAMASHELGHAFGLQHTGDTACWSVMSHCSDRPEPSAADVAAARRQLRPPSERY